MGTPRRSRLLPQTRLTTYYPEEEELAQTEPEVFSFDINNRHIQVFSEITPKLAKEFSTFAAEISRRPHAVLSPTGEIMEKANDIVIEIFSIGGCVQSALNIFNILKCCIPSSIGITTIGNGLVASAATVIFAAGDKRKSFQNTRFLIHETSLERISGTSSELRQNADLMKEIEAELLVIYKDVCSGKAQSAKFEKTMQSNIKSNKDWIFSGKEALDYGFVTDLIIPNRG